MARLLRPACCAPPAAPRLPRIVVPGLPHHVTQRSNRRAQVFIEEGDYALYKDLLAEAARKAGA